MPHDSDSGEQVTPTVYASGPIPPRSWKVVVANNQPFVSIGVETVAICATVN